MWDYMDCKPSPYHTHIHPRGLHLLVFWVITIHPLQAHTRHLCGYPTVLVGFIDSDPINVTSQYLCQQYYPLEGPYPSWLCLFQAQSKGKCVINIFDIWPTYKVLLFTAPKQCKIPWISSPHLNVLMPICVVCASWYFGSLQWASWYFGSQQWACVCSLNHEHTNSSRNSCMVKFWHSAYLVVACINV